MHAYNTIYRIGKEKNRIKKNEWNILKFRVIVQRIQSYRSEEMKNQNTESIEFCLKTKSPRNLNNTIIEIDKFPMML